VVGVSLDSSYKWWEELVSCCIEGLGFDFLRGPLNGSLARVEKHCLLPELVMTMPGFSVKCLNPVMLSQLG
jgi:hypothetical protein